MLFYGQYHNFFSSTCYYVYSVLSAGETKDSIHWVLPKLQGAPPQGVSLDDHAPFIINRVVNKDCRRGRAYWKVLKQCMIYVLLNCSFTECVCMCVQTIHMCLYKGLLVYIYVSISLLYVQVCVYVGACMRH